MTKKKAKSPTSAGRPRFGEETLTTASFRCSTAQREKLKRLGGAAWIRSKIDTAKEPS